MHSSLLANVLHAITHESGNQNKTQANLPPPEISSNANNPLIINGLSSNSNTTITSMVSSSPKLGGAVPSSPGGRRHSFSSSNGFRKTSSLKLQEYACGEPKLVSASTSGNVQLYLSLQESTLYLPDSPLDYENILTQTARSVQSTLMDSEEQQLRRARMESFRSYNEYYGITDSSSRLSDNTSVPVGNRQQEDSYKSCGTPSTLLRGSVIIRVAKPTKVKGFTLTFSGTTRTYGWNMGSVPPQSNSTIGYKESFDITSMGSYTWNFIPSSSTQENKSELTTENNNESLVDLQGSQVCFIQNTIRVNTEIDRRVPFFKQGKSISNMRPGEHEPVKKIEPGEYLYHFVLAIPPTTTETTHAELGTTSYLLDLKLHRGGGPFAFDQTAKKEVLLVRSPPSCLDTFNNCPVNISRTWSKRLDYDILIPHRYVILGSPLEIKIQLRPLDKIQVHRVKILLTERVAYHHSSYAGGYDASRDTTCGKVRIDPPKRLLILDNKADTISYMPDDPDIVEPSLLALQKLGNFLNLNNLDDSGENPTLRFFPVIESGVPLGTPSNVNRKNYLQLFLPSCSSNPYITISHSMQVLIRVSHLDDIAPKKGPNGKEENDKPDTTIATQIANAHHLLPLSLKSRRLSMTTGSDVKHVKHYTKRRRFFDIVVSTPICILSNHIQPESLDLPLYNAATKGHKSSVAACNLSDDYLSVSPPLSPVEITPGCRSLVPAPGYSDVWGSPLTPVSSLSNSSSPFLLSSSPTQRDLKPCNLEEEALGAPPDYKDVT